MRPVKLSKEEYETLRRFEPMMITASYDEYERRFEAELANYNRRAFTLAELDTKIEKMLYKETL